MSKPWWGRVGYGGNCVDVGSFDTQQEAEAFCRRRAEYRREQGHTIRDATVGWVCPRCAGYGRVYSGLSGGRQIMCPNCQGIGQKEEKEVQA